jgi:hypothetical protein
MATHGVGNDLVVFFGASEATGEDAEMALQTENQRDSEIGQVRRAT